MPKVSLTSKMVREPEDGSKKEDNTEKRKKKDDNSDTVEFESCVQHLRVVVGELESSNFQNILEILRMEPSLHVEWAVGTMIAK